MCGLKQSHLHLCSIGHNVSLTTSRGDLANRIAICPQCVLGAFTSALSCGQALLLLQSDHPKRTLMQGLKGVNQYKQTQENQAPSSEENQC